MLRRILFGFLFLASSLAWGDLQHPERDYVLKSWQIEHPVVAGTLSGLAAFQWPKEYGDDAKKHPAAVSMNFGYSQLAFSYVKAVSKPIFETTRLIVFIGAYGSLAILVGLFFRRRIIRECFDETATSA